jgi:two-component system OmpR family sensor kinase
MKLFKSIKWRLQLWYGLILVVVLAGFGGTAYQMERNRQFRRVDGELHRRIGVLAQQMHRPPRGPQQRRPAQGELPDSGPLEDGPLPQFPDDGPPIRVRRPPNFTVTPQIAALFDDSQPNQFYFCIYDRDGKLIARSDNFEWAFTVTRQLPASSVNVAPVIGTPKPNFKGLRREFIERLPSGETVRVGGSLSPELKELRRTALNLTAVGGLILLVGLAGGWWLVRRSLRPISEISATAAKISAGDLSQRINVAEAESELGQLAAVLNSTFARLETAFAQQKQFASDAAHELRTPVSVILTQTQTALNRERDAASYKQTVEACQRAAQRMRRLIESLLELARFDAGQEVLRRESFDLAQTVSECAELVKPLADEREMYLVCELAPLEITGDPGRLAQVVTNLLTNAIQYNQPGGEVRVALEQEADTGQGMAPEDLPRVFGRFFRADASRTGAGNAGLGLAICKAIVEAHGGTIEVASEENVGTTFTVRLPV